MNAAILRQDECDDLGLFLPSLTHYRFEHSRLDALIPTLHCFAMLRPEKKYSVCDLRQLKGKRCLTHVHVKSPEEAAAAEAAEIDFLSCSFDTAASQARLPLLVAAAPKSFISGATPHGLASPEEAIRVAFRALELGAAPFIARPARG